jgi:hypothetical protein
MEYDSHRLERSKFRQGGPAKPTLTSLLPAPFPHPCQIEPRYAMGHEIGKITVRSNSVSTTSKYENLCVELSSRKISNGHVLDITHGKQRFRSGNGIQTDNFLY